MVPRTVVAAVPLGSGKPDHLGIEQYRVLVICDDGLVEMLVVDAGHPDGARWREVTAVPGSRYAADAAVRDPGRRMEPGERVERYLREHGRLPGQVTDAAAPGSETA